MSRRKTIKIVNIVLVVVFVFAAFNVGKIYYDYSNASSAYNEIQNKYVSTNIKPSTSEPTTNNENDNSQQNKIPISIDFDALLNKNQDVIGWLYCPNTIINYPVVQGNDNDYYLRRYVNGKYLVTGTLFADYRNNTLGEDSNYIIYGHNMKNGTMFSMLTKYKEQAYYNKHPVMYYLTPDKNYKLELFAGLVIKRDDKIYSLNQSAEDFTNLLKEYRAKSTFKSNIELNDDDTIVTLSTCSYEFDNARYIVIGRLIPA